MFLFNSLRIVRSFRALLQNRQIVYRTVTCSAHCESSSFPKKDSNRNLRALWKETELIHHTTPVRFYCTGAPVRFYCTGGVQKNCWNCQQPLDKTSGFFCVSCKVVQPPEKGTSYFKIMDCDYTFSVDTHKLRKRYLQLQRSLHPDNFSQKSVREQEYSINHSILVNEAYQTLRHPLSRGLYMLELQGITIEEGTDSCADQEFLMELMEINIAIDEAQTVEEANKIGQDTKGKLAVLTEEIDGVLLKGDLHAAKNLLAQMKYYVNTEEKVNQKLSKFI